MTIKQTKENSIKMNSTIFSTLLLLGKFFSMLILHSFVRAFFSSIFDILRDLVACIIIELRYVYFLADSFSSLLLSINLSV